MHRTDRPLALTFVSLLAVALSGCATRTPPTTAAATPPSGAAAPLPFDPSITHGVLPNGLAYYVRPNHKPEKRAELWLVVNAGSVLEDDDQQGLAHFVEHMAFNGTRRFAKQQIIDYLESIGMRFGADLNAATSFDDTIYNLTVPTDRPDAFAKGLDILQDWASGLTFDDQEIDRERGVVIEEWRLGRGADGRIRDRQLPVLFHGSRYAERLPIGKKEILEKAPHDALRRFYRDWYRPDLMAVIAVGDFPDPQAVATMIRERFAGLANPRHERPRRLYPVPPHAQTLYAIATDPEATATSIAVYHKEPQQPQSSAADYRRSLVERLYHSMLNARLDELGQQADPPFLWAASGEGRSVRTADTVFQGAGVKDGGVLRGLDALLTEIERVRRHGFTLTELEREKADVLRGYEQAYAERDKQESRDFADELSRNFLEGESAPGIAAELDLARAQLPTITLDEVNRLAARWTSPESRVVLVSAPERHDAPPPAEGDLRAVFAAVAGRDVPAYVDRTLAGPLVPEPPKPGTIVARSTIPEIGVTEWRLSNGVRVLLKPTDFKNDEILLAGFQPGGHSLVPDSEFLSASIGTSLLRVGGLGRFDEVALQKALAGKVASAGASVSELEQDASGEASPQDAETMFELLYLSMTAPRRDPAAEAAALAKLRADLEDRLRSPGAVYGDRLREALSSGHFRRRPLDPSRLGEIHLDQAYDIFRQRFADANGFTFVIVGNLDLAKLEPLVLTWIGGLPSAGRHETWRDIGVPLPALPARIEVRKGIEPKAQVSLVWTGPAEWSRESSYDLDALADVLRIRLREVLREDKGGVYGVGVSGSVTDRPQGRFSFRIGFGCAPERVDELVAAALAEVRSLRDQPVAESYTAKVRETDRREREVSLKRNGFWVDALLSYLEHGVDPRLILRYDELVERSTPAHVEETARRFLDPDRYLLGVLRPEGK